MVDFFILFFIKATIILSIMHLSGMKWVGSKCGVRSSTFTLSTKFTYILGTKLSLMVMGIIYQHEMRADSGSVPNGALNYGSACVFKYLVKGLRSKCLNAEITIQEHYMAFNCMRKKMSLNILGGKQCWHWFASGQKKVLGSMSINLMRFSLAVVVWTFMKIGLYLMPERVL